jgi:hypothetical protein
MAQPVSLLVTLAVLAGLSVPAARSDEDPPAVRLDIVHADNTPVRIESASIEPGSSTGLRVRYVVTNLRRQPIDRLILTAATVNAEQQVTATRMQAVEDRIDSRGRKEQFVVFARLVPAPGERVVVGVQAVGWSTGPEWRGVLRLASRTTASD